jgi:dolichol-phosphate mannosyltransferase
MPEVLVIIPTYNESENIGTLIDRIFEVSRDLHVLVVDDASPDGTADVVSERQKTFGEDKLFLIVRNQGKAGRGSACLEGFKFAREKNYNVAIEMDADLSHDPADVPHLLDGLSNADVVVGSKYIKGGKVVGWEWYRKILSRMANLYVRTILRMPIHDYTNGYRCYGPSALAKIPELEIEGTGFTVIPQMSYQLWRKGMRFKEVPIVFANRRKGKSNMSIKEIKESFLAVIKIRSHAAHLHLMQLFKFGTTGFTNLGLDLILLSLFVEIIKIPLEYSAPLSTIIVVINVFFMNKYWTFKNNQQKHVSQGVKFALVYGSAGILVNLFTIFFTNTLGIFYIASRIISIFITALWNYTWMHLKVFKH